MPVPSAAAQTLQSEILSRTFTSYNRLAAILFWCLAIPVFLCHASSVVTKSLSSVIPGTIPFSLGQSMNYYITDGVNIKCRVVHLDPDPPVQHREVTFSTDSVVSGTEVCIVSQTGRLYFVLQKVFTPESTTGVVTEIGNGDVDKVLNAIDAFGKTKP
jgi:hypothetical protein